MMNNIVFPHHFGTETVSSCTKFESLKKSSFYEIIYANVSKIWSFVLIMLLKVRLASSCLQSLHIFYFIFFLFHFYIYV